MRRLLVLVALAGVVAGAAGCGGESLAFRTDERVEIVAPADRAEVSLPLRLRWTADLDQEADGGPFFAVFIDREPIRPGQSLRALADDSCNRTPGCPDLEYLRDRYVFVTDERSLTIDVVPQKSSAQRTGARDSHEAIIVLVDADGRRLGEAAYTVEFVVEEA